jgi:hypothetical protein
MRDNILPTWEDPANQNGGCWSYKIATSEVFQLWTDLSRYTVSEILCKKDNINGISISPKKGFCIIKIWNSDATCNSTRVLIRTLAALDHEQSLYTAFKAK